MIFDSLNSRLQDYSGRRHLIRLARDGRAALPKRFTVRGVPVLEIVHGAQLRIGHDVLLDSRQRGYHVTMWGPVRFLADRPGAIISLGADTRVHASGIHAELAVTIGSRCLIAANCQIMDSSGHALSLDAPENRLIARGTPRPVTIEDDVWLGTGVIVLPGTHIGEGSVVAAGSVVSGRIPPRTVVRGNPSR